MSSLTPEDGYGQECGYPSVAKHPIRLNEHRVLKKKMTDTGESHAIEFIAKMTTIPVPKIFETGYMEDKWGRSFYIVMEYIPGKPLHIIWKDLSDEQKADFCHQLDGYLAQLRELTGDRVMAIDGGALDIGLYQPRWIGPYDTVEDFHHSLAKGEQHSLGDNHSIHFAHADLAPRNIIVDEKGRINAIIDWEQAGWYPEYWDAVRMTHDRPLRKHMDGYTKLWSSIFTRIYREEYLAMADLVRRTVPPYPTGNVNEQRPDVLPSYASHAKHLLQSLDAKLGSK